MANNLNMAYITEECVACGCCVKTCPMRAMVIHRGLYAKPDENKCVGCGKCVAACPANVIDIRAREAVIV